MPVITLTTEWQVFDYYNGMLKGRLSKLCPDTPIIDNANGLTPFNLQEAAFVIRNTFSHYPEGSVHIICVQTEADNDRPHVMVEAQGHYFIGADNGIFHLILNSDPDRITRIASSETDQEEDDSLVFARVASSVINGDDPSGIGEQINSLREMIPLRATIEDKAITGSIIYIDSYGNAISNITRDVFLRVFSKKKFIIAIRSDNNVIKHISKRYNNESVGELLAVFNSLDLLEIGINGTNASELLSLKTGDVIRVAAPGSSKKPGALF